MSETFAEIAARTGKPVHQVRRETKDTYKSNLDAARGRQLDAVALHKGGATYAQIGRLLDVSAGTVGKYIRKAREEGKLS